MYHSKRISWLNLWISRGCCLLVDAQQSFMYHSKPVSKDTTYYLNCIVDSILFCVTLYMWSFILSLCNCWWKASIYHMRREGSLHHNTCYDTGPRLHGLIWRTVSPSRILWQTRSTVDLSTPRSPQNLSWIHTGQIDHLTYLCADTSYITYISRMFAYFFFQANICHNFTLTSQISMLSCNTCQISLFNCNFKN